MHTAPGSGTIELKIRRSTPLSEEQFLSEGTGQQGNTWQPPEDATGAPPPPGPSGPAQQNVYGQQPSYGQQQNPYGQQQNPYAQQQNPYGQQQDPYGQQNPYGQQQNPYGQQQNPYGQQYPQQNPYPPSGPSGVPGQGWAPAPKPGLIPLRPLGFGTLLGTPFRTLTRNPKVTFGSALLVQSVTTIVSVVLVGLATWWALTRISSTQGDDLDSVSAGSIAAIILTSLVTVALSLGASAFLQGVIVTDVSRASLGEKLRLGQAWKATWPHFGKLLIWVLIIVGVLLAALALIVAVVWALVLVGGGFIVLGVFFAVLAGGALVAALVWIGIKLSLVPSIIVLENRGIIASVKRSWSLTNGYFWRTLGVQWLVSIILSIVSQVVTTPVSILFSITAGLLDPTSSLSADSLALPIILYGVLIIVTLVVSSITVVVTSAAISLIYIDLRMRKEGLDLELIRYVERRAAGDTSVPNPYTTVNTGFTPAGNPAAGGYSGS